MSGRLKHLREKKEKEKEKKEKKKERKKERERRVYTPQGEEEVSNNKIINFYTAKSLFLKGHSIFIFP